MTFAAEKLLDCQKPVDFADAVCVVTPQFQRGDGFLVDQRNRNWLTKVSFKNSGGTELKSVEYFYNVYNRLICRKYDADGPGSDAATNIFFVGYDGINPTLAFDGTAQTDVSNRFLWGPQVDKLFADEQVTTPTSEGNVPWLLGDQVGTLRDIADYNVTAYTVTNHRTFDSFGNLTAESQPTVDEIFAYTGKFFDEVTKLFTRHFSDMATRM